MSSCWETKPPAFFAGSSSSPALMPKTESPFSRYFCQISFSISALRHGRGRTSWQTTSVMKTTFPL